MLLSNTPLATPAEASCSPKSDNKVIPIIFAASVGCKNTKQLVTAGIYIQRLTVGI